MADPALKSREFYLPSGGIIIVVHQMCPQNPEYFKDRCKNIQTLLANCINLHSQLIDMERLYFSHGLTEVVLGVRIATFDLKAGPSGVAIPQYFLGEEASDQDHVMLVEADHTEVIDTVDLENLVSRINSLS